MSTWSLGLLIILHRPCARYRMLGRRGLWRPLTERATEPLRSEDRDPDGAEPENNGGKAHERPETGDPANEREEQGADRERRIMARAARQAGQDPLADR